MVIVKLVLAWPGMCGFVFMGVSAFLVMLLIEEEILCEAHEFRGELGARK